MIPLRYRTLGPFSVSEIALGTWQVADNKSRGISEEESVAAILEAVDQGVNLIDTANAYGFGYAEEVVGKALAGRRDQVVIATKGGTVWDDSGRRWRDSSPAALKRSVEESLKRLRTDVIDLYQIHWPDPNTPVEESWQAMMELIQEGKIKAAGVSNYNAEQIRRCLQVGPVTSLQLPYHMFHRDMEKELLPLCQQEGIVLLPYGPLGHGMLSGKMDPQSPPQLPPGDWRWSLDMFHKSYREHAEAAVRLQELAARHGRPLSQLAIAWILRLPEVASVIVGARTPAQVRPHLGASGWTLTPEELAEIDAILAELPPEGGLRRVEP